MSKQKRNQKDEEKKVTKTVDYYKLKTKAVNDLVTADESNSPEVSEEELKKYRSGPQLKIADWLKMVFIKFWFVAAVCYFFIWGLSTYTADYLDLLFVTGIALGIATDLLTNNALRFFAKYQGANDRWMMFPEKGYASFPLNILYSFVVLFCVFMTYGAVNYVLKVLTNAPEDSVPLAVEPILFGLFYLGFDLLLIKAKHVAMSIVNDAKRSAAR